MTQALVHTLVRDCMATQLVSVTPYDTLAWAYEQMIVHRIRRLPVLDDGQLCGIITLSDLLAVKQPDPARRQSLADIAHDLARLVVSTTMTKDPQRVFDNDTIGHAAELMLEHKIGGLPVVDTAGQVVGMITESNIFALLAQQWRDDNARFSGAHQP